MAWLYIRKMMKKERFDIVHAHFIIPTGVLALWMKKKYKLPYVLTAHGSDVMGHNQKRFKILHKVLHTPWKKIVRNAGSIVSPSQYLDELIKKQLPRISSVIIPNGVDTTLFQPLVKQKKILVMCRLQETKNVQTIIKAFSLIDDFKDWKLQVAGDGPYYGNLKKLAMEVGIADKVEFLGWVQNKSPEHVKLVGEAAIYVSASYFENSPVSVLEALSSGCIILLSDIPAHRILVSDVGCIFGTDDINGLYQVLVKKMEEFDHKIPTNTVKPMDWRYVAQNYLGIYNSLVQCR